MASLPSAWAARRGSGNDPHIEEEEEEDDAARFDRGALSSFATAVGGGRRPRASSDDDDSSPPPAPRSPATAFPGRCARCLLRRLPRLPRPAARLWARFHRYVLPALLLVVLYLTSSRRKPSPIAPVTPRPVTLLSTDFHTGPIGDLKDVAERHPELRLHIVDMSLSQACKHVGTCATPDTLKVLRQGDVAHSLYVSDEVRLEFFEAYRSVVPEDEVEAAEAERARVAEEAEAAGSPLPSPPPAPESSQPPPYLFDKIDAVICSHPTGQCELYMPFNVSMILWATTRFEQGRERSIRKMNGLVKNLRAIASKPWNVIAANNPYDVEYIRYFTGVTPVLIRSLCAYADATWSWERADLGSWRTVTVPVIGYRPGLQPSTLQEFIAPANDYARSRGYPFRLQNIHEAYSRRYAYSELASHPAVLHLPYQVSVMSFYEQYRMGIPIFAPSLDLLTRWQMEYILLSERGWYMRRRHGVSLIPRHPSNALLGEKGAGYHPECRLTHCDPYDDYSYAAVRHWLSFSEYYKYPHVITFNTWEDLVEKLHSTDFPAVSRAMREHAAKVEAETVEAWAKVLTRVAEAPGEHFMPGQGAHPDGVEQDYAWRMDIVWGEGQWALY